MRSAALAGLALALAAPAHVALAQATNPAARPASATPRFAMEARAPLQVSQRAASGASPFAAGCGDSAGTVYIGSEVEPHLAVNPLNPSNLIGSWQQDRFSNGGARGLVTGISLDGGATWSLRLVPWSACTGGEYTRATDPWVTFGADGTAYQIGLGISGTSFTDSSVSAVLVARSTDGGLSWSNPATLIRDSGPLLFNDKESITADPGDARFVYAAWDRLRAGANGPTLFARTTDSGITWEPAREIYDPGGTNQTIANLVRVLPDGTLVNLFTQLDDLPNGRSAASVRVIRSTDRGLTWSAPIVVSSLGSLGARDTPSGTSIRDGAIVPQMAVGPGGALAIVWQDARFTLLRDAIAFSRSIDGGLTWSTPVRVNAEPAVVAFTPQVEIRADGMIGVTYYDLRSNTADLTTLPTDFWLARSSDGVNWTETRVSEPFDLALAPRANGAVFLGDYTGLVSAGNAFIPFYAKANADTANRTDIVAARVTPPARMQLKRLVDADASAVTYRAPPLPDAVPGEAFWEAVSDNLAAAMERRVPGWSRSKGRGVPDAIIHE